MVVKAARKLERGQALPLLVLVLIGLAAFAALALDGGNLWTEQRRAQAAADNAVMAAAYQQMQGETGVATLSTAAFNNAAQNGYVPGPATKIDFHLPPVDGAYAGDSNYMEVVITQTVPTALAHLIYQQNPIPLTVRAVAHGTWSKPFMANFAIASMYNPDCSTAGTNTQYLTSNGGGSNGGITLTDGGAFVNASCPNALTTNGNPELLTTIGNPQPQIQIAGNSYWGTVCTAPGVPAGCNFWPAPTTGTQQLPQDPLAGSPAATLPYCANDGSMTTAGNTITATPGKYTSLAISNNKNLVLLPGIYCLSDGALSTNGGDITGKGVLIYLVNPAASFNFAGSGNLDLEAPTKTSSGCAGTTDTGHDGICPYLGIVIYKTTGYNTCNKNDVEIGFYGSSSMKIVGLIYAPYSLVDYGGNGNLTQTGQTVAGCVVINGNGQINIVYNPNATYTPPPLVALVQ